MYSLGFKSAIALVLLCACAQYISCAFPTDTACPSAGYAGLTLTNKDDFAGSSLSSSWTAASTPSGATSPFAATAPSGSNTFTTTGILTATIPDATTATAYTLTYTQSNLGSGVRVIARVMSAATNPTSGTGNFLIGYAGWQETGSTPKTYLSYFGNKATSASTTITEGFGYRDASVTTNSGSAFATQLDSSQYTVQTGVSGFSASSGLVTIVDILPKNISWATGDTTNASPSTGLYKAAVGTAVTTITPASTGSLVIGGTNNGGSSSGGSLALTVDWIAQFNYPTASSPAAPLMNKSLLALFSLVLGALIAVYLKQ